MGFVVIFKLLEVPVNAPPRGTIHSCDMSEHSTLGSAPPAPNGILRRVRSHPRTPDSAAAKKAH